MSEFSGKCDVYDTLIDIGKADDNTDWSKIHIYHEEKELNIKSIKDLVPYFPFLTSLYISTNKECHLYLSKYPFPVKEEKETLAMYLKEAQKYYKKCRRNKKEYIPEEAASIIRLSFERSKKNDYVYEICLRVKEHPSSANTKNLYTAKANYYRQKLYEEMLRYGYDEQFAKAWCFDHWNQTC